VYLTRVAPKGFKLPTVRPRVNDWRVNHQGDTIGTTGLGFSG